jgi:hypothetical protein
VCRERLGAGPLADWAHLAVTRYDLSILIAFGLVVWLWAGRLRAIWRGDE